MSSNLDHAQSNLIYTFALSANLPNQSRRCVYNILVGDGLSYTCVARVHFSLVSNMSSKGSTSAESIAKAAKTAFEQSQLIPSQERITALHSIRDVLQANKAEIMAANKEDLKVCHCIETRSRRQAHPVTTTP